MAHLFIIVAASLLALVHSQTLAVGTLAGFESPYPVTYVYLPTTDALQIWSWSGRGGVAAGLSPFDPAAPVLPPSPGQYAFMQTGLLSSIAQYSCNMSTTITGLVVGQQHRLSFYIATRYDNGAGWQTQDQETVLINNVQVWQSEANFSDASGWRAVNVTFTPTATSSVLMFQTIAATLNDRSILVDSVLIQPVSYTGVGLLDISLLASNVPNSFESPSLNTSTYGVGLTMQPYAYNPPVSSIQPWTWFNHGGGIARVGSPFDPPPPTAAPSGTQYAFIQTSANSDESVSRTSWMSTTLTGLTASTSYSIGFSWAARSAASRETEAGWQTQSQIILTVDGATIYSSAQNLTDLSGWNQQSTSGFAATSTTAVLVFNVVSLSSHDHTILIDAVSVDLPPPTIGFLPVNTIGNFEAPYPLSYAYLPAVSLLQRWAWSGQGGVAADGSPFDPPSPSTSPSPSQYAFLQIGRVSNVDYSVSNMSTMLTGMISGNRYTLSFWIAARYDNGNGNSTQDTAYVYVGNTRVYQSEANFSDAGGWRLIAATFVAPATTAKLTFNTVSTSLNDRSLLIDSVVVRPTNYVTPVGAFTTWSNASSPSGSFESPSLDGTTYGTGLSMQNYMYCPEISRDQPWTFQLGAFQQDKRVQCLGGLARRGSAFDPPPPIAGPAGSQYAFIQTSPNSEAGFRNSSMSTTITGLTQSTSYAVSFYWAARAARSQETENGYETQAQLTVYVNGFAVYISESNLTDVAGWKQVTTVPFLSQSSSSASLVFTIQSISDHDHTILIDAVSLVTPVGQLAVGQMGGFESPLDIYIYSPPVTASIYSSVQPWTWQGTGGTAQLGSPWDPPADPVTGVADPPSPGQYAFLQTGNPILHAQETNMSTMLIGLTPGVSHTLSFWIAARFDSGVGNQTYSQETVFINEVQIWQSLQNFTDVGGWRQITATFTPSLSSAMIVFRTKALTLDDRAILIDSVLVTLSTPAAYSLSTVSGSEVANSFEYPMLSGHGPGVQLQSYMYDPVQSCPSTDRCMPWTFSPREVGGIARVGSPFDPPAPAASPSGTQYAFIQTSPNGRLGYRNSSMTAPLSGLTVGRMYSVNFYWAVRSASSREPEPGYQTQSLVSVFVNNQNIFQSVQNLTDTAGWNQLITNSFTPSTSAVSLMFLVTSISDHDHTLLFDAITINLASSSSSGPVAARSSSSSSVSLVASSSSSSSASFVASSSSISARSSSSSTGSAPAASSALPVASSSSAVSQSSTQIASSSTAPIAAPVESASSSSITSGAIAGAVVGSLVGAAVICLICFWCTRPRSTKLVEHDDERTSETESEERDSHASGEEHTADIEMA